MAGGQISPSPIDFHRRPYNTLALPCERVIAIVIILFYPFAFVVQFFFTPPPIGEWRIVMSVSVSLSVRDHIFGTTRKILIKFFVHVTYGRGSVFLWQCSDTSFTSSFVDNVLIAHSMPFCRVTDCTAALFLFSNRHIVKLVAWHSSSEYGKKLYLYIVNV